MLNKYMKLLFVFSVLFLLVLSLSFVSSQVNVEQVEDLNKKVESGAEKLSDIIAKQKDDKGYLTREIGKLITQNKFIGPIDNALRKIDIAFVVLFNEHYSLVSGVFWIVLILWVWIFFKIGDLLSKGTHFSSVVSHLLSLGSVVVLAQIGVFHYISVFILWAIFAKDAWWFRIIIAIVVVFVIGIVDYLERMLGKYLEIAKKANEEAKTHIGQGVIERYAEGLRQGGNE